MPGLVRGGGKSVGKSIGKSGAPKRLGLLPYFAALLQLSPPSHVEATVNQGETGRPGVAELMLADADLEFVDRGTALAVNEWPDLDLAVRGLAAAGPSWPALQSVGYDEFAKAVREAIRPLWTEGLGIRIISEFGWILGRVPGALWQPSPEWPGVRRCRRVDGYVDLHPNGQPGLGAYAHSAFGVPVIGVAKSRYATATLARGQNATRRTT